MKNSPIRAALGAATEADPRWAQIKLRDKASDGAFVYSVKTTGVYCRPSCAARLPNPANVGFHVTPAEARAAGFRACKRCKPDLGKAAPHAKLPALYLVGTVQGQRGFFRSTDGGATWLRINDDQHQWGLVLQITGDPKKFGRVYVGTHGRGIFYGDPKTNWPR